MYKYGLNMFEQYSCKCALYYLSRYNNIKNDIIAISYILCIVYWNVLYFFFMLQDVRVFPDSIKQLPLQLNDTVIYYENELLIVESERGLSLICNMNFQYCTFHVSGIKISLLLLSIVLKLLQTWVHSAYVCIILVYIMALYYLCRAIYFI